MFKTWLLMISFSLAQHTADNHGIENEYVWKVMALLSTAYGMGMEVPSKVREVLLLLLAIVFLLNLLISFYLLTLVLQSQGMLLWELLAFIFTQTESYIFIISFIPKEVPKLRCNLESPSQIAITNWRLELTIHNACWVQTSVSLSRIQIFKANCKPILSKVKYNTLFNLSAYPISGFAELLEFCCDD